MSERDEITTQDAVDPADLEPSVARAQTPVAARQRSGATALALLLALLAAGLAGYAAWRVLLIERGNDYGYADVLQRLEAFQTRLTEAERRSARSHELAGTLREQLTENERLHERLREDLLAQNERSGRMEALLARLSRERGSAGEQLALNDASLLLSQAQARLDLFGDRHGAMAALALAEQSLARAGGGQADVRAAVADARAALAADARPATSVLLAELDAIAAVVDAAPLRVERAGAGATVVEDKSWWGRQFERFDQLVTIRRVDEDELNFAPTKDAARRAIDRARLAVLEHSHGPLPGLLAAARNSLLACCEAEAIQDAAARLQQLAGLNWNAATPDLGALRERLDNRVQIEQMPPPEPRPMLQSPAEAGDEAPAEEDAA